MEVPSDRDPSDGASIAVSSRRSALVFRRGDARTRIDRIAAMVAALTALVAIAVALRYGAAVAGGSDAYGYVSQAHLWATGRLRVVPPLASELAAVAPLTALAPLGYRVARDGTFVVPTYAPGLPIAMAAFERLFGPRAVFWVVPLLGSVAVWATFLLGDRVAGPAAGACAALLLATSPAFLFQLTAPPMSDLPVTAWWTLALALALSPSGAAALGSGIAAGLAIVTRPNLVPLVLVPGVYLTVLALARRRGGAAPRRTADGPQGVGPNGGAGRQLIAFAAAVVPACFLVAAVNARLYGAPLRSGYHLAHLFGTANALPNLTACPALATAIHTPLIWLAAIAPLVGSLRARRAVPILLPAIPALLVSTAATILALARRLPRWGGALALGVVALLAGHGVAYARARPEFANPAPLKYERVGTYVARQLPERAVVFAKEHSGSVRYYSGRATVRWDLIPKRGLDRVVATLDRLGYHSYFVLEDFEQDSFRRRFRRSGGLGRLDLAPLMELPGGVVRVYDAEGR